MNLELIGKALAACPIRDAIEKRTLRCLVAAVGIHYFAWVKEDVVNVPVGGGRQETHFNAHNAMTAAWLAWLIDQGFDPMFLHNKGMVVLQIMNYHKGDLNDCVGDTLVECLAAAVVAVHEANQQEASQ